MIPLIFLKKKKHLKHVLMKMWMQFGTGLMKDKNVLVFSDFIFEEDFKFVKKR